VGARGARHRPLPPLRALNFLLVHGAGEEPSVWEGWEGIAIDLQAGLNVAEASMLNYEAAVACDAGLVGAPLCIVARGMGALAVLLAARRVLPAAIALIEPWPPEAPSEQATRPESQLALEECRRGLDVPEPDAPVLVVESRADPYAVSAWARKASASAM
jgi:hypothetical protein